MFGRKRKHDAKALAETTLAAASAALTLDSSLLTQLDTARHAVTPAHKALLAGSLATPPVARKIVLAETFKLRDGDQQSDAASLPLARLSPATSVEDLLAQPLDLGPSAPADQGDPSSASPTLKALIAIFEGQGWPYQLQGDALLTVADGMPLVFTVDEELEILYLLVPLVPGKGMQGYVPTKPEAELSAAVYMLAANFRLPYGAFARDHRDGEIRFESSLLISGAPPRQEQIAGMMVTAVAAVSRHAETLFGLYTGRLSLKQALSKLEGQRRAPEVA